MSVDAKGDIPVLGAYASAFLRGGSLMTIDLRATRP
jgi:hypothetical protein